jgi:hypothetical protein
LILPSISIGDFVAIRLFGIAKPVDSGCLNLGQDPRVILDAIPLRKCLKLD